MSADLLRRAAALMRERAEAVKPLGSVWDMGGTEIPEVFTHGRLVPSAEDGRTRNVPDLDADAHFASWHPAVALAVADILDHDADSLDALGVEADDDLSTLAVARAYLDIDD